MKSFFIPSAQNPDSASGANPKSVILILGLCCLVLLLSACHPTPKCADPSGCWYFSPQETIGLTTDSSSVEPARSISIEIQRGLEIFLESYPTFHNHLLKLVVHPVRCYPDKVSTDYSILTGLPDLFAFIGPSCLLDVQKSIRLLDSAGVITLSPNPSNAADQDMAWISLNGEFNHNITTVGKILANHYPTQSISWVIENTLANREIYSALCPPSSPLGFSCADLILVDLGVTQLQPYLPPSVLAQSDTWAFLFSVSSFAKLANLNLIMAGKTLLLLDPQEIIPPVSTFPISSFSFIGPAPVEFPPEFTHTYEKRYNGQNTLISFRSYQAAKMIYQALENSAVVVKDGSLLLPRTSFYQEIEAAQPTLQGLCFYQINLPEINLQDPECP